MEVLYGTVMHSTWKFKRLISSQPILKCIGHVVGCTVHSDRVVFMLQCIHTGSRQHTHTAHGYMTYCRCTMYGLTESKEQLERREMVLSLLHCTHISQKSTHPPGRTASQDNIELTWERGRRLCWDRGVQETHTILIRLFRIPTAKHSILIQKLPQSKLH